jgi:beta-glucosidase
LALMFLFSFPWISSASESYRQNGIDVQLSGHFFHAKPAEDVSIQGTDKNSEANFREEIVGDNFTVTISHLPAGNYNILLGEAETYVRAPGQRIFDVASGDNLWATNFDIFAVADGFGKVCHISAKVEHKDDAIGGPLKISFVAHQENAKFNTLEISDASGNTLVKVAASDFKNAFDAAAKDIPAIAGPELWKDANQPVDARVADLVRRLSLAEKARQLDLYNGSETFLEPEQKIDQTHAKPDAVLNSRKAEQVIGHFGVAAIHDLYPKASFYNSAQKTIMQSSRLGIPALFIEEGLHGYLDANATEFPQSVNLASTWNSDLARETGAAIASEARANGVDMILGPVLDIPRDPRWGRVEEDFGEDPFLSGRLGLAYVQGMQGDSLATDHTVIAEPKHFAAHGSPESGLNTAPAHAGEREVRTVMLKSFEPTVREGNAFGIMASYNDIDGIPCIANPWLLTEVLRQEWGFNGFVLSDLGAIRRLYDTHHTAASPEEAVWQAINAGVDMQFYDFDHTTFQNAVVEGVENGEIASAVLDQAVSRALRMKFLLGLFDHPFVDVTLAGKVCRSPEHLDLSLEVARQSMCLLKNQNGLLPLDKNIESIAVIGPNANITRLGDYSDAATENSEQGMLEQIKKLAAPTTKFFYSDGQDINKSVEQAKRAKVIILGLGEWKGISGECYDRSGLNLPGNQEALLEAVAKTGIPVILVLQNGRALTIPWAAEHVPAILEAWYPGEFGGRAIAETLFGDNNPGGHLTVTFPRDIGQLPVFYNHFPSKATGYVDGPSSPQFVFGYGLSYTQFKYNDLKVVAPDSGSTNDVLVSFDLMNTGSREGDEVAQLYVRQNTSSVVTPVKALKGFSRITLKPGESRQIKFNLKQSDLALWNAKHEWKVEPGEYTVMVGGNSVDDLSTTFFLK